MQTKITVLLLLLLIPLPCFAQQPRIDSIAVDEDKDELVLHGNFQNSSSAIVLVDSVSLPVVLASDTLIRATLPVSGKGSCGIINVLTNGKESNKKLLSYIHFFVHHEWRYASSPNYFENSSNDDTINVRLDFSNFSGNNSDTVFPSSKSFCVDQATGSNGLHYDSSAIFRQPITYSSSQRAFSYDIDFWAVFALTTDNVNVVLDNEYYPIAQHRDVEPYRSGLSWGPTAPTDFPPSSASVREILSNLNIIQAHLSSDPIISNADVIITLQNPNNVYIQILDILGHIISSEERMLQAGMNKFPINSSALSSGIYICRLQAGSEVVSVRFVKE